MTWTERSTCAVENTCVRLKEMKAGTSALVAAVERYLRQDCLRSELCATLAATKRLMK